MSSFLPGSTNAAIGLFDSGVGGLTVLKALQQELPYESFIYFGDTARLPYGEKSSETIQRYSIDNAHFLLKQQIKMLIIACNTASAHALDILRDNFSIPIVGVVIPGAKAAVEASSSGRIGILGTRATICSGCYEREIHCRLPSAKLLSVAAPLLVPLIEEHLFDHPATRLLVQDYLKPLKEAHVDTLLLGCTHYPLLRNLICEEMGADVSIVDSAEACAREVKEELQRLGMTSQQNSSPYSRYFVSDDPERFKRLSRAFLSTPPQEIERCL